MAEPRSRYLFQRLVAALISCILIALGVATLLNHNIEYRNWWGGFIFAPFAVLIGMGLLIIVVFRPIAFGSNQEQEQYRRRRTEKAHHYRDRK